jgi:hypothetical protein
MPSRYEQFDRSKLTLRPLSDRDHDMTVADILPLDTPTTFVHADIPNLAEAIRNAHEVGASVILMIGAHVIKQGLSRFVIDLIQRGQISAIAGNGACAIHDYELARVGASTESVARYISEGQFGLWTETSDLNDIIASGDAEGLGLGEAVGKAISESDFPHKDISIFAAAFEAGVPATVHVGIGYDIIHEHPNVNGAALGSASYRDFLIFTRIVENLEGGVLLNYGTAIMGPEVYLKAMAMARNVAKQEGRTISNLTTAVFDLLELPEDLSKEASKDCPAYYYRPYKTILVRTVADGGKSFYIRGDHKLTFPALHAAIAGDR